MQADIDRLYAEVESLNEELFNVLDEVDTMLADWEEVQDTDTDTSTNPDTEATDATTRWSLDAWTDYDSYKLLDIDLDSKTIEEDDDYTIWLLVHNANIKSSYLGEFLTEPSTPTAEDYYYNTNTKKMHQYTGTWIEVGLSSIYQPVEVKEIAIQFSPKSSDRVVVDESQTELYSSGYPSFDWSMDFSNRTSGTCKRIEATTETRFSIPVPTRFFDNDPMKPYPEEFKLEFELAYKQ